MTILKTGSKGPDVKLWQAFLGVEADGDFGPATLRATVAWQRKNIGSVAADGIVGSKTLKKAVELGFKGFDSKAPLLIKKQVVEPGGVVLYPRKSETDAINAAMLNKVAPTLQIRGKQFLAEAAKDGWTLRIVQGLRTFAEQQALYEQGRTKPGKKVTNAKAGQSLHNYGLALDFAPIVFGEISWNEKDYGLFGKWADRSGLEWGGRWKFVDLPHVQDDEGMSLSEIQQLYRAGGLNAVWNRVK